jgi:hypothetical protein
MEELFPPLRLQYYKVCKGFLENLVLGVHTKILSVHSDLCMERQSNLRKTAHHVKMVT